MTISSTVSEISYDGDDVSVSFPIPFVFDTSADLAVIQTDEDGNPVVLSSGFSITGGAGSTGTLTLDTALPDGETLTILDDPERSQSIDYIDNDSFPAESAESGFDRGVRISKRLYQLILKSMRVADGDPAAGSGMQLGSVDSRKGKYLFFNAVTGAIEYAVSLVTTVLSQSIIAQLLNPQTAAEAAAGVTPTNYQYTEGYVLRYGTNNTPGTTDLITAMQDAHDVVKQAGGGMVEFPFGETIAQSDTLGVHPTVGLNLNQCTLVALASFPATIAADKFGGSLGTFSSIPAPQVWYDGRLGTFICVDAGGNGHLDGDGNAPTGLLVSGGANIHLHDIHCIDHTVSNVVYDAPQNTVFDNIRADSAPVNYRFLNAVQHCTFIANSARNASANQVEFDEDTAYPMNGSFSGITGPTRNTLINCIWEDTIVTSKTRILWMNEGDENYFIDMGLITGLGNAVTVAGIEIEATVSNIVFIGLKLTGQGEEFPAIIQNGFQISFEHPRIHNWGTSTLTDLIECTNRTTINRPHYSSINVTGKYVRNTSGSPNDGRLINYIPIYSAGTAAQVPTEDVDAFMRFYDEDSGLIVWDFVNDIWVPATHNDIATAAQIADIANALNTTGKYLGKEVWDTTNKRKLRAAGTAAGSDWEVLDGSAQVTPA